MHARFWQLSSVIDGLVMTEARSCRGIVLAQTFRLPPIRSLRDKYSRRYIACKLSADVRIDGADVETGQKDETSSWSAWRITWIATSSTQQETLWRRLARAMPRCVVV